VALLRVAELLQAPDVMGVHRPLDGVSGEAVSGCDDVEGHRAPR
jgi:hypothetical protein